MPMTKYKLRIALRRLPNVVHFCERHGLAIRTVMRLRTRDASPTQRTIDRLEAALIEEARLIAKGVIDSEDEQRKPGQRGRVARRKPEKVAGRNKP